MDFSEAREQLSGMPGGLKSPRLQSGDIPAGGFDTLAFEVVICAPGSRRYQLFDHYA